MGVTPQYLLTELTKQKRPKLCSRTILFGTWNIQGFTTKTNEVQYEIQTQGVDIAETKKK